MVINGRLVHIWQQPVDKASKEKIKWCDKRHTLLNRRLSLICHQCITTATKCEVRAKPGIDHDLTSAYILTMTTLSDKAKGKQRALDSVADPQANVEVPKTKPLVVRFTEGIEDLSLQVEQKDTVREVKRKVRLCSLYQECC